MEAGACHYAVVEVDVDKGGTSEIDADVRPETWAQATLGAATFGGTQVIPENAPR